MTLQLFGPINTGIATGGDGSAASNADGLNVGGTVVAVAVRPYLSYLSTEMDLEIKTKGASAPEVTILSLSGVTEAGWYYPRPLVQDGMGADLTAVYGVGIPVFDQINVAIAAANDDDHADVWLLMEV